MRGLPEGDANPLLPAPDDMAMMSNAAAHDVEGDFVRYARRARDLKPGSAFGNVANCAMDACAVELDRSRLVYALSGHHTSVVHRAILADKF